MKILGIITARKNSKRLKGKNVKILGSKPLIQYTFDIIKKVKFLNDVMITTDDEIALELAKKNSILAPWLRPSKYSKSSTSSFVTAKHAYTWYNKYKKKVDAIALFQPTSPFRKLKTVNDAFKEFKKYNGLRSVISVSYTKNKITLKNKKQKEINMFCPNGLIFISPIKELEKFKSFISERTIPLINYDKREALDIDYPKDWKQALKNLKNNEKK